MELAPLALFSVPPAPITNGVLPDTVDRIEVSRLSVKAPSAPPILNVLPVLSHVRLPCRVLFAVTLKLPVPNMPALLKKPLGPCRVPPFRLTVPLLVRAVRTLGSVHLPPVFKLIVSLALLVTAPVVVQPPATLIVPLLVTEAAFQLPPTSMFSVLLLVEVPVDVPAALMSKVPELTLSLPLNGDASVLAPVLVIAPVL